MRLSKIDLVLLPAVLLLGYWIIDALLQHLGFFGLGLLGLAIGFVAVMVELEGGDPIGGNQKQRSVFAGLQGSPAANPCGAG